MHVRSGLMVEGRAECAYTRARAGVEEVPMPGANPLGPIASTFVVSAEGATGTEEPL